MWHNDDVSVTYRYIAAADDDAAATMSAARVGGPASEPDGISGILGPDPVAELTALEGLLRGLDEDAALDLIDRPDCGRLVGGDPDREYLVTVARGTVDALLAADDAMLGTVVESWSQIEEFDGLAEPEGLLAVARGLRAMFARADAVGAKPYVRVRL